MRIDKKTITKVSLILLSSITIIPNMVLASEATVINDTHYYNNYYFFTGRYDDCLIYTPGSEKEEYRFLNTKEGGTNKTSFASSSFLRLKSLKGVGVVVSYMTGRLPWAGGLLFYLFRGSCRKLRQAATGRILWTN